MQMISMHFFPPHNLGGLWGEKKREAALFTNVGGLGITEGESGKAGPPGEYSTSSRALR